MNGLEMLLKSMLRVAGIDPVSTMQNFQATFERFKNMAVDVDDRLKAMKAQNDKIIALLERMNENENRDPGRGREPKSDKPTDDVAGNVRQLGHARRADGQGGS